ncbi:restriction endonuclease subunit S [Aeromonas sp. R7-3]|uniref:restriction endonuclease subunit S n=1 Tax=Aeromonas sp. R7-3 TaxID=3138475 RepID=UPI0034A1C91A
MTNKYKPYAETLDSGVDWIGHIPTSWKIVPLKAIADIDNGGCYGAEPEDGAYLYPVATTAQIDSSGHFWVDNMSIRSFTTSEVVRYLCREGDILVVKSSGSSTNIISGKAGIVTSTTPKFIFSNFLMRVSPKQNLVDSKFVYALLISHLTKERIKQMVSTTTYPNLQVGEYCSAKLPLPPLPEQQAIAAFLDYETARIDKLIAKQQQLIELLKEKRQAVISHAVTKGLNPNALMKDSGVEWLGEVPEHWVVKKLKHVAKIIDCKNRTPEYVDDGDYLVVRTTNVKNQSLVLDGALYTNNQNFKIWTERGVPPIGSILFTREAPTGEVCLVPKNTKLCMGQRMMNFIAFHYEYTSFLFDYLTSDCLGRYISSEASGSTVSHLRVEQVYNIPVVVPPMNEQAEIDILVGNIKKSFSALIDKSLSTILLLQERRTALISAAVTGKIDLRGWKPPQDEVAA